MRPYDADQFEREDPFPNPSAPILYEVVQEPPVRRARRRRMVLPLFLFVVTCLSVLWAGGGGEGLHVAERYGLAAGLKVVVLQGLKFALPLMTILICHEMGHFVQARRYGVHASFPFFIPMPLSPLGTMGAVIAMEPRIGDRKALFDIGITGPLAGLVPTMIFCLVGLHWSSYGVPRVGGTIYGDPLLFQWLAEFVLGPRPEGYEILVHPMAFAAWAGFLVTSLNLVPIGQLDGGHILYALLRKKAYPVATLLLAVAAVLVLTNLSIYGPWLLMLLLLIALGPKHPPTQDDSVRLGPVRIVLGWLTLAFIVIGFTPQPIVSMG